MANENNDKHEFLQLKLTDQRERQSHLRKHFLELINEQLYRCYLQNISAVSEAAVKEHGPDICIDFAPFEPLRLSDIPKGAEGWSVLVRSIGRCFKAQELVEQLERETIESETRIRELEQMATAVAIGRRK